MRPGRTTGEIASVWPKAQEFGFPNEEACFALQYGHGIGLAVWEKPVISRLVSLEHSHEIKPGMVFADDLRLMDGPLLVPRGYQITDWFLTRLHNFRRGTVREPVRVRVPLATKDDAVEGEPERRAASEPPVATRS